MKITLKNVYVGKVFEKTAKSGKIYYNISVSSSNGKEKGYTQIYLTSFDTVNKIKENTKYEVLEAEMKIEMFNGVNRTSWYLAKEQPNKVIIETTKTVDYGNYNRDGSFTAFGKVEVPVIKEVLQNEPEIIETISDSIADTIDEIYKQNGGKF